MNRMENIMRRYNQAVMLRYKISNFDDFEQFFDENYYVVGNKDGNMVSLLKISGDKTISGQPEILEY